MLGLVAALTPVAVAYLVVPQLASVYSSMSLELPIVTSFVVDYFHFSWLLPICVLAAWLVWPVRRVRGIVACAVGVLGSAIASPLIAMAMYLPIMHVAA